MEELKTKIFPALDQERSQVENGLQAIKTLCGKHKRKEQTLREQLGIVDMFFDSGKELTERQGKLQQLEQVIKEQTAEIKGKETIIERLAGEDRHLTEVIADQTAAFKDAERDVREFETSQEQARRIASYYQTDTKDIYSGRTGTEIAYKTAQKKALMEEKRRDLYNLKVQAELLGESSFCMPNAEVQRAVDEINKLFASREAISGSEYLYNQPDRQSAAWYLQRYPLLPYSVIMTVDGLKRLGEEAIKAISLRFAVPVVLREILHMDKGVNASYIYRPLEDTAFILPYETEQYLSKDVLNELRSSVHNKIAFKKQAVNKLEAALREYHEHTQAVQSHLGRYPTGGDSLYKVRDTVKVALKQGRLRQAEVRDQLDSESQVVKRFSEVLKDLEQQRRAFSSAIERLVDFLADEERVNAERAKISQLGIRSRDVKIKKEEALKEEEHLGTEMLRLTTLKHILSDEKSAKEMFLAQVQNSIDLTVQSSNVEVSDDQSVLIGRWKAAVDKLAGLTSGVQELTGVISNYEVLLRDKSEQFNQFNVAVEEVNGITYSFVLVTELEDMFDKAEAELRRENKWQGQLGNKQESARMAAVKLLQAIRTEYIREPQTFSTLEPMVLEEIQAQLRKEQEHGKNMEGRTKKEEVRLREFETVKMMIEEFARDELIAAATDFQLVDSAKDLENGLRMLKDELIAAKTRNAETRHNVGVVYKALSDDFGKEDMAHIKSFLLSFAAAGDSEAIYDADAIERVFGDSKLLIENNLKNWR